MRIGIMLRALGEKGGVGVYTENLVRELLDFDRSNEYVLLYRRPENLGHFGHRANLTERVVKGWNRAIWDQIGVPYACWRERLDVVFHPKFTVPLLAPCKAVMVVHGADWFIPEQAKFYQPWDVRYIRTVMPLYFRKAAAVISVSQLTTDNFNRILDLPIGKVKTVYFGPARQFRRVTDPEQLRKVQARYRLPDKFILTLTKRGGGERKNLRQVFKSYARYHADAADPTPFVVGGKNCDQYREEYGIPRSGYGRDILFPGWLEQSDLPAIYSLADLYLYPSNLEAFPIPITEAMACGTPVITSNTNGLQEIAGDAALLVDPGNERKIAAAIGRVLGDPDARANLSARGLERAKNFTWDMCVREILATIEQLPERGRAAPASNQQR